MHSKIAIEQLVMPRDKKPMLFNDTYEDKGNCNFENMSLANSCVGSVVQADN